MSACGETTFGSKGGKADPKAAVEVEPLAITSTCVTPMPVVVQAKTAAPWTVDFSAELCPAPSSKGLHVVMMIDTSYSMRQVDLPLEGNCGRLAAGKALVASLRAKAEDQSQVRLSLVYFAEKARIEKRDIPLSAADELTTMNLLCMIESEPNGFTNYKAAFDLLPDLENAADLTRMAYFVSDGVPTIGGDAAAGFLEDAIESKRRLEIHAGAGKDSWTKASVGKDGKPWTLNALFLGNKLDYSAYGFDPEAFLTDLTGSTTRVVLADADDLAQAIVDLPLGVPGIDPTSATAVLKQNGQETPLELASLARSEAGTNWTFSLISVVLEATESGTSQILVTATDGVGRKVESLTDIRIDRVTE